MINSRVDREFLRAALQKAVPDYAERLERLFVKADRTC
jgi:hypothetical protein